MVMATTPSTTEVRSGTVRVNGVRLYYEELGQGPAILGVHGTGSSALMWGAADPELASLGRVIVYDRRGCIRSQRPDLYDTTSTAEHADDAAALLDALGAAPAAVIGRSYGGEIVIDLALRHPECVRGLALLEGAPSSLSAEAAAWAESLRQQVLAPAADDPNSVGENDRGSGLAATVPAWAMGEARPGRHDPRWQVAGGARQQNTEASPADAMLVDVS
jgi:pimeloyl-ACP methyl ester carboxylesterase